MTNAQIIRLMLEFLAIVLVLYCIYREKDIAKWERKVWRRVKVFFKALLCTVRDKTTVNRPAEIIEFPTKKQLKVSSSEVENRHKYKNI